MLVETRRTRLEPDDGAQNQLIKLHLDRHGTSHPRSDMQTAGTTRRLARSSKCRGKSQNEKTWRRSRETDPVPSTIRPEAIAPLRGLQNAATLAMIYNQWLPLSAVMLTSLTKGGSK